jgi:lipopolysaccharide transport system permease protein
MAVSERRLSDLQSSRVPGKNLSGPPAISIEASQGWASLGLRELWLYRELVYFLIWRDVKVRYKQTVIGAAWAIIQPLLTMLMFAVVFKQVAHVQSDGLPYSVFTYTALLPWTLFSGALERSSGSVVRQSNLVSKVYFPRLIVPLAAALSGVVDFAIAFLMLIVLMVWFGLSPTWGILALPVLLVLTLVTALAVGLWLSALNVRYRDIGQIIPFVIQFWLFASPVAYPVSMVPQKWRLLYSLNPLAGIIEGFRWALLGKQIPDLNVVGISTAVVVALLFAGIVYFKRMERSFADLI